MNIFTVMFILKTQTQNKINSKHIQDQLQLRNISILSFIFIFFVAILLQMARSHKREVAVQRSLKASDKYLTKFLQAKILEQMTGEEGSVSAPGSSRAATSQPDMFELPPLAEDVLSKEK